MIPKTIHYCWFGKNPLPEQYKKYMETWKRYCSDYEIKEWNEDNFDINSSAYCREAYKAKKWAFVSDYARLKVIYECGGIYLDTDVEMVKPITPLVSTGIGFLGFQNAEEANTGLGFAAAPHNACVKKMLDIYELRNFEIGNETYDMTPCPVANTVALMGCGLKTGKSNATAIQHLEGLTVYPICYFNPINPDTMKMKRNEDTYLIHHYSASWSTDRQNTLRKIKKIIPAWILEMRTNHISRRQIKKMKEKLESR